MIPKLICPTLNRPDLLVKMLASIDVPVGQIIIIDNGGMVPPEIEAIRLPHNIGVAASWNLGITVSPRAPWWLIVNDDIEFGAGDLDAIAAEVETSDIVLASQWSAFAITAEAIEKVGWFDPSFYPAYYEDNDYHRRAILAGVSVSFPATGITHHGSSVIKSDDHYRRQNDRTFTANKAYYISKWGGEPNHETFATPFNQGCDHVGVSIRRLRDQAWTRH